MKAYGHHRKDKLTCEYGCCGYRGLKRLGSRKKNDKYRRKTARRWKFECE
jgi:hypothetical protein